MFKLQPPPGRPPGAQRSPAAGAAGEFVVHPLEALHPVVRQMAEEAVMYIGNQPVAQGRREGGGNPLLLCAGGGGLNTNGERVGGGVWGYVGWGESRILHLFTSAWAHRTWLLFMQSVPPPPVWVPVGPPPPGFLKESCSWGFAGGKSTFDRRKIAIEDGRRLGMSGRILPFGFGCSHPSLHFLHLLHLPAFSVRLYVSNPTTERCAVVRKGRV